MPTPTSLEQPPNTDSTPADAIAAIGRGEFTSRDLIPLSDLRRADVVALARVWPSFPEADRERVIRTIAELAESNVQYVFGRALRVALTDSSPVIRQLAIAALWEDEGRDLIPILLDFIDSDSSQDVRSEAAQGLSRFADMAAEQTIDPQLADRLRTTLLGVASDPGEPYIVRRRALESVAVFGDEPDIVELIRDAYDADDAGLKAGALYAMGRSLDSGWLEAVVHEFNSPDAEMRYEAARASGELADDAAVPGLVRLATDEDVEVRQAAIAALGRIGGTSSVNALRRLAPRVAATEREAVEDALEEALVSVDALRVRP